MTRFSLRDTLFIVMLASPAAAQGFDDYPFLGSWSCGQATYTFTAETFNDGAKEVFIKEITEGLHDFRIILATDTAIDITAVTDTTMDLTSGTTADHVTCTRLP